MNMEANMISVAMEEVHAETVVTHFGSLGMPGSSDICIFVGKMRIAAFNNEKCRYTRPVHFVCSDAR